MGNRAWLWFLPETDRDSLSLVKELNLKGTMRVLRLFDCVVVITDRRVLDHLLQDAVYQIDHAQGVVFDKFGKRQGLRARNMATLQARTRFRRLCVESHR